MFDKNVDALAAIVRKKKLRVSINIGNPVLASKDESTGELKGISVDLARVLARTLNVEIELLEFDAAAKSVEAVANDRADIGFFAIDPKRSVELLFTAPYILIEGCYLVRDDAGISSPDQVDIPGRTIVVGQGSAYDLFLSRTIRNAEIVRISRSDCVVSHFMDEGFDVAAGVRQQLQRDCGKFSSLKIIEPSFMTIQQAMAIPRKRGEVVLQALSLFLEGLKANKFIHMSSEQHCINGIVIPSTGLSAPGKDSPNVCTTTGS